MVKKLFAIILGLFCMTGLNAQTESTIDANDILYWVGEGDNDAIFVVDWGTGARAWGYHFGENATIEDMISAVDVADPRFANAWGMIAYTEYPVREDLSEARIKANGVFVNDETTFALTPGMIVKLGTPEGDIWETTITPATVMEVPVDATVEQSDILYWAGEGADSMIVALAFGERNLSYAWGLKFTAPITVSEAILALAAADERVSVETLAGSIQNISYVRGEETISFTPSTSPLNMMQFILDGDGWAGWTSEAQNGSFLKIRESAYATGVDTTWSSSGGYPSYVVWPTKINLVGPVVESATISAEDIVYWVGEGSNRIVFVVNWADTALAWGYRFNTESVSMQTVMDDIAAADHRFSYELGDYGVGDIKFAVAAGDTLRGTSWWGHELNNMMSAGLAQPMANGDFSRWYNGSAAIAVEGIWVEAWGGYYEYTNAFPQTIHPVSVYVSIDEVAGIDMQVYPNPANEQLNVTFDAMKSNTTAAVYDMAGRMVYSQTVAAGTDRISINTAAFNGGVYMLRIANDAVKVVVRH